MAAPMRVDPGPLLISVRSRLTPAEIGKPYGEKLEASGGRRPYRWALVAGTKLPPDFRLDEDGRITSERVERDAQEEFGLQVTDADGKTAQARTSLSTSDPALVVALVQRRGVFLFQAVMVALGVGGLLLLVRFAFELEGHIVTEAARLRAALNITAPAGQPDWYLLGAMALAPCAITGLLLMAYGWYRRVWTRRLEALWGKSARRRELTRISAIPERCSEMRPCAHCQRQLAYLQSLLGTVRWKGHWEKLRTAAGVKDNDVATVGVEDYRAVANAVFAKLESDIAERAVTAGLLVGVSRNRWFDSLTIAASSLEMQLYVLSILGKRPSMRLWLRMLQRAGASLFLNAYLERDEVFALNLVIQRAAWGLEAAADASDWVSDHISKAVSEHGDSIDDHTLTLLEHQAQGEHLDASDVDADDLHHSMGGIAKLMSEVAMFSFSVGSVALRQLAAFVEHWSNALLQGALAGGILYWHGCDLAAEVLAMDSEHRQSGALRRAPWDGARKVAAEAGILLRRATRNVRAMYRERRLRLLKSAASKETLVALKGRVSGWLGR